jgi:nicotinamidase-related amidase
MKQPPRSHMPHIATPTPGPTTAPAPANTALVVIDMQTDFCGRAAMSTMGYDLSLTRAPIGPIQRCWPPCRAKGATT